jgi:zinc transport system ATP-binding protein
MPEIAVEAEKVNLNYGLHAALSDINFKLEEGSFLSVVGPNGGGKSSLLKSMIGLVTLTSGRIRIFNQDPVSISSKWIGYVPQIKTLDRLFPAKSIELVATGISGSWSGKMNNRVKDASIAALDKVGAAHLALRQLGKLSGGELQRIYLARSIAREPRILLLDEPVTGIDNASEKDINRLIDDYRKESNATIIMVTHDWEAAFNHADYVLLLNGKQICYDTPKKAFSDEFLRELFGHIGHKHTTAFGARDDA